MNARTCAEIIFAELIQQSKQGQVIQPIGDLKNKNGRPLSFFLIDEISSSVAMKNIYLIIPFINLCETNAEEKNCIHYLLTLSANSTKYIEEALKNLNFSPINLKIEEILLQQAKLSINFIFTPLEYAAFMKCHSSLTCFLNTFQTNYASEIKTVLHTITTNNNPMGKNLIDEGVDKNLLSQLGFP